MNIFILRDITSIIRSSLFVPHLFILGQLKHIIVTNHNKFVVLHDQLGYPRSIMM